MISKLEKKYVVRLTDEERSVLKWSMRKGVAPEIVKKIGAERT